MIFTPRIVALVGLIVFVAVLLQLTFFSQITVLTVAPNLLPVVVVAIGLLGGAVPGAVTGFAAGLLLDAALGSTLGVASLALMAAGYLGGRWREGYDIVSSLVPPLVTGGLAGVAAVAYAGVQLTLGVEAPVSLLILREVLVQAILGGLLAVPFFPLIRRLLRPALIDDGRMRRRRTPRGILGATG